MNGISNEYTISLLADRKYNAKHKQNFNALNSSQRLSGITTRYFKRISYFVIFYILLTLAICGYLNWYFYFQVSIDHPKLTGLHSQLKMNPGLSCVPNPDIYSSLIHFRCRDPLQYVKFLDEMIAFLHFYQDNTGNQEMEDCVQEGGIKQDPERPCVFNLNSGGPCNIINGYGFDTAQPCFALKLGKIHGWVPDPVDFATGTLVKCEGWTRDDTFNLGTIRYYDMDYKFSAIAPAKNPGKATNGSFHSMYYPYRNQVSYHQPLVFVQFDGVSRNIVIKVKCYLIAKNIHVDFARNEGSVSFEILID